MKLAKCCVVISNGRGWDIRIDINENKTLIHDIKSLLLTRKLVDSVGVTCGTIENICVFRIYKLWIEFYKQVRLIKLIHSFASW